MRVQIVSSSRFAHLTFQQRCSQKNISELEVNKTHIPGGGNNTRQRRAKIILHFFVGMIHLQLKNYRLCVKIFAYGTDGHRRHENLRISAFIFGLYLNFKDKNFVVFKKAKMHMG